MVGPGWSDWSKKGGAGMSVAEKIFIQVQWNGGYEEEQVVPFHCSQDVAISGLTYAGRSGYFIDPDQRYAFAQRVADESFTHHYFAVLEMLSEEGPAAFFGGDAGAGGGGQTIEDVAYGNFLDNLHDGELAGMEDGLDVLTYDQYLLRREGGLLHGTSGVRIDPQSPAYRLWVALACDADARVAARMGLSAHYANLLQIDPSRAYSLEFAQAAEVSI